MNASSSLFSDWGSLVLSGESIYFHFLYWNRYLCHRELAVFVCGSSFHYSRISWLYLFFFPFLYQKSAWHTSNCVYPLQLIDSHTSASNVRYYWERFLFASLIKPLFTGAYSYNKINWWLYITLLEPTAIWCLQTQRLDLSYLVQGSLSHFLLTEVRTGCPKYLESLLKQQR